MNKVHFKILLGLIWSALCVGTASAQSYKESRAVLFNTAPENINFHIYSPSFFARPIYNDTLEAVNRFPEQVLISMISASSQEWVNYNYWQGKGPKKPDAHFRQIENMNPDNNYFALLCKYEFTYNGRPAAFVKYSIRIEDEADSVTTFKVLQKHGDRWYVEPIVNFVNIPYMLHWFKVERLAELFSGQPTGNPLSDEMIAATRDTSGGLDFNKLALAFKQMYEEGKETERFQYFVDLTSFRY